MDNFMVSKKKFIMLLLIIPIAVLAKIYEYRFLGENAFKLINYVLDGIFQGTVYNLSSLDFPVKILSIFKFLHLNTPVSSGVFCAIFMNLFCYIFLLISKIKYRITEYIFIYFTLFILNFTVFDFNKDIIQFCIVFVIYLIILNDKNSDIKSIILSEIILVLESIFFRSYYILLCGLFPMIYYLLRDASRRVGKKRIIRNILVIMITFFAAVYMMQYLSHTSYIQLLTRRNNLENIEAATMIRNVIPGDGFLQFCINYCINLLRCLFPIELLLKGVKYFIFAFYMFYITFSLVVAIRNITSDTLLPLSFVLSYCMMLAASESDFGTFVRHQAVLFFFYLIVVVNNRGKRIQK